MAPPEHSFHTCRLSNIPPYVELSALQDIISSETRADHKEAVVRSSLTYDPFSPKCQVGTITWSKPPEHLQSMKRDETLTYSLSEALGQAVDVPYELREVRIDAHFYGFTPLNHLPEDAENTVEYVLPGDLCHPTGASN